MLNPVLAPAGASRFVRALALAFSIAALAAAANPTWTEQQELAASDGLAYDEFGWSVSVSGDTAVIGASGRNNAQGAAYVWVRSGGEWSQQQELTASDGAMLDEFGYSVSVSGDTAVIGAWNKTINLQQQQGAAYVFVRSGGVWTMQQELTASDAAQDDGFGLSVSVSGETRFQGKRYFTSAGTALQASQAGKVLSRHRASSTYNPSQQLRTAHFPRLLPRVQSGYLLPLFASCQDLLHFRASFAGGRSHELIIRRG